MAIIPLISTDTVGPLGVKHLPRLWLKALLAAEGQLPEGYKDIRPGFDFMLLEGIRIDPEAARTFINENTPSYLEFEAWIRDQPGVDVSPENIAAVNKEIETRQKAPESRTKMLKTLGLPEDTPFGDSIMMNNLDDWREIHEQVTS